MSRIWVPKFECTEPKSELVWGPRMRGRYRMQTLNAYERVTQDTGWFDNLILTGGRDHAGAAQGYIRECVVGTDNTSPVSGDTSLGNQVAEVTASAIEDENFAAQGSAPYYGSITTRWRFPQGDAEGNLTEVGVKGSTGPLWSRALILDSGGSPTTLVVQADEFLDVTYQIQIFPPTSDVLSTINIGGSDYDITLRASNVTSANNWAFDELNGSEYGISPHSSGHRLYDGAIGAITSGPSGTNDDATTFSQAAYTNGNFYRDGTITWGLDKGLFTGGIESCRVTFGSASVDGGFGACQVGFSPAIPKTDTQALTLTFRHEVGIGTPV